MVDTLPAVMKTLAEASFRRLREVEASCLNEERGRLYRRLNAYMSKQRTGSHEYRVASDYLLNTEPYQSFLRSNWHVLDRNKVVTWSDGFMANNVKVSDLVGNLILAAYVRTPETARLSTFTKELSEVWSEFRDAILGKPIKVRFKTFYSNGTISQAKLRVASRTIRGTTMREILSAYNQLGARVVAPLIVVDGLVTKVQYQFDKEQSRTGRVSYGGPLSKRSREDNTVLPLAAAMAGILEKRSVASIVPYMMEVQTLFAGIPEPLYRQPPSIMMEREFVKLHDIESEILTGQIRSLINLSVNERAYMIITRTQNAITERQDPEDAVIDAVIALESLFSAGQGTTLRLRASMAWFLAPKTYTKRQRIFDELGKLYKVRGAIVHGNRKQLRKQLRGTCIHEQRDRAIIFCMEILNHLIHDPGVLKETDDIRRTDRLILGG